MVRRTTGRRAGAARAPRRGRRASRRRTGPPLPSGYRSARRPSARLPAATRCPPLPPDQFSSWLADRARLNGRRSDRLPTTRLGPWPAADANTTTRLYWWRGLLLCLLFRVVAEVVRSLAVELLGGSGSLLARGPAAARSARASCSQPADAPGRGRSARDACSASGAALGPAPGIRDRSDSGRTTATAPAGAPPRPGTARPR
jgi:hypothetical protein